VKLANAATYFDRTVARDAYNHAVKFKCQIEPLDLYRMDGTRVKVRGMDTAPGIKIPTRRVINIDGQDYLVSAMSGDQWAGKRIRQRFVIQGADDIVQIKTIKQELDGDPGVQAFASIDFNKYNTDERDSSDYHPQYHVFLGPDEPAVEGGIISTVDQNYLIRNVNKTTAGLRDALVNVIDDPFIDSAVFASRTYDPLLDSYAEVTTTVRCIRVRWQEHFMYLSPASEKFQKGDMIVLLPNSVTVAAGDNIDLTDGVWNVRAVVGRGDYQQAHVRRA
jgi:hypothetical protein